MGKSRCRCNHCPVMPTAVESQCCREIPQVWAVVEGVLDEHPDMDCITSMPGFQAACLDPTVLFIAYSHYRQQYGPPAQNAQHQYVNNYIKCSDIFMNIITLLKYLFIYFWCWIYLTWFQKKEDNISLFLEQNTFFPQILSCEALIFASFDFPCFPRDWTLTMTITLDN